ncbi:MAG: LLM class flavin-dependent oxidoreductase [Gammaproteobacteria bacterium]|nr:LLM class flavin-dependent oxidoreductase [Gammaproteobacteria bacterium]
MLKLGLYSSIANPPNGDDLARCTAEAIEEAVLAEACGFDSFFFGEHHQDRDGFLPSPVVLCAAVAARTSRIRVGTSVLLLPLHHPIQVAEDVATVDIISNGRMVLGVGLGYQEADFRAFGVDRASRVRRFEESIDIMRLAWSGEPFSYSGTEFEMRDVQILPRPVQRPGPPIWIGGWVPPAVERAARMGDAWVTGPSMDMDGTAQLATAYRAGADAHRRDAEIVLMRDAWVAPTQEEAAKVYGPEVMKAYRYYWRNRAVAFQSIESEAEFTLENLAANRVIMGTPQMCVQQFQRWSEALPTQTALLRLRHAHSGGPPHKEIMKTIELFGRDVIPHLT